MSVIVIGMEMPVNCANCFAISDSFGWCKVSENEIFNPFSMDGHPSFCPLRPLPEKHGRLGDIDAIMEEIKNRRIFKGDYLIALMDIVDGARTIVEAEGE